MNLSRLIFFDFSIAYFKFDTDKSPHPSNSFILSKSILKISCGNLTILSSQNFSTIFFPNPSIFNASFDTKCFMFSIAIFSHWKFSFVHLLTASYFLVNSLKSFTVFEPHEGHLFGNIYFVDLASLLSLSTETTCGITSPALSTLTVSLILISFRFI